MARARIPRRSFLRATGVCLALPPLESLCATSARAAWPPGSEFATASAPFQRMVCIGNEFGMYPGDFWPKSSGTDYELSPLLQPLAPHRDDFTLFSHLDHGVKGGHFAVHTYLTGVKSSEAKGMPEGGISLDQRAAEFVGSRTRFPSLTIGSESGLHGGCQMSWTRTGTRIPPVAGPRELFRLLFIDNSDLQRRAASDRINLHGSILDAVMGDARSLERRLGQQDRQKLQEYFASVRDVEVKLELDRHWQQIPKPKTDLSEPENQGLARDLPLLYDLIVLALQTDSTRVATLEIGGSFVASDLGIRKGYHSLSHHGKDPKNLDLLTQIELYQVEQFSRFLEKLKASRVGEQTLLENTMVLMGSGMGNANSHTNNDLPIILAGGGFRHGEFKELPQETNRRVPLCNLYLSMLQHFGVESDRFSNSTGTLTGLEQA